MKVTAHDGNSAVTTTGPIQIMTANRAIFAVTVSAEMDRWQNAVMVVWCGSCDGDLPSPSFAVFPDGVPVPFQRRCLARSTVGGLGRVSHSDGHSVVGAKKKPVHRRTNPSGSFPLAGVLVWLSMYRLKSRIQLWLTL